MKKTCFLAAILLWAPAFLLFPLPCHADLTEMSDLELDRVTGQSGSFVRTAKTFAGTSDAGREKGLYPRRVDLFGIFFHDWILESMEFGYDFEEAIRGIGMAYENPPVETDAFQRESGEGHAGIFSMNDFRAQFSGNVLIYTPAD